MASILGYVIYYSGLSGGFMMDDISNLSNLSVFNGEITWDKLKEYIGLSKSGILKRPISIFSFLLDSNQWPAQAWSFKRTNVFIHLLNGILLFTIYYKIFNKSKKYNNDVFFIAAISMVLWLYHPFLVSTVLYIVQRMALLTATFVLIGLLIYIIGRNKFEKSNGKEGQILMLTSMYILPVFAVLSKENGILLVYLILLVEFFVMRNFLDYRKIRNKLMFWLYIPPFITTLGLLVKIPSFVSAYSIRDFSVSERILTQFRVLSDYIYNIYVPKFITQGAYTDGYSLSKGLFEPITTLISIVFLILLIVVAWNIKKRHPLVSFSIFFFFVAHLLESTIIPLELYYEHRNYIPMFFIFLPVIIFFNYLRKLSHLYYIPICIILVMLMVVTYRKVNLWGDNFNLHQITMNKYPSSNRAITMMAIQYEEKKDLLGAYNVLKNGMKINHSFDIKINYLNILCSSKNISEKHLSALYLDSKSVKMTRTSLPPFTKLFSNIINDNCGLGSPIKNSKMLLKIIEDNSFESHLLKKPKLYMLKAQINFRQKKFENAVNLFIQSFQWERNYNNIFFIASDLMLENQKELALKVVNVGWVAYQEDFKYSIDWFNYKQSFQDIKNDINKL